MMKLKDLKQAIDKASEYAGDTDPNVEVWWGEDEYKIKGISQFGVIPDVMIEINTPQEMLDVTTLKGASE